MIAPRMINTTSAPIAMKTFSRVSNFVLCGGGGVGGGVAAAAVAAGCGQTDSGARTRLHQAILRIEIVRLQSSPLTSKSVTALAH